MPDRGLDNSVCVCVYGRFETLAAYYRTGRGENLSRVKREKKRFVPLFFISFASIQLIKDVSRSHQTDGTTVDIHRRFGPRELTLSTPHLLVADAEQVSQLSTCQKEKLIISYIYLCSPMYVVYSIGRHYRANGCDLATAHPGSFLLADWLYTSDALACTQRRLAAPDLSTR